MLYVRTIQTLEACTASYAASPSLAYALCQLSHLNGSELDRRCYVFCVVSDVANSFSLKTL